eukprot:4258412-Pyramimonas_sp.AAC.1
MWVVLLHPGATNTSSVIKVVSKAAALLTDLIFQKEDAEVKEQARRDNQEEDPTAQVKYTHPPRRQLLAGGGSAAATGMQMSCSQNRSAALSAEPEVDQILSWFSAEGGIDGGVVAKLWDGLTWHRPVMEKRRAFEVKDPWWGLIAGGHVPELHKAIVNDHFGFRQRVT